MRRPLLAPLTPLYAAGLALKNSRFDRGSGVQSLKWPVISVGSISAGGAGKTPVVAALVSLLREVGWTPDILSRGYGRQAKGRSAEEPLRVDPQGPATVFGDEPLVLARGTGAPVFVANQRLRAGRIAENSLDLFQKRVHVLDDGFQHRQLKRDFDVVLVTLEDFGDALIPAGNLREPLRAIGRASAIVVREEERAEVMSALAPYLPSGTPMWIVRRMLRVDGVTAKPVAFCGLARPEQFFESLRRQGIAPVTTVAFQDHADYRPSMMTRLKREAQRSGADGWITTTKDVVKIDSGKLGYLGAFGPVAVADVQAEFLDPEKVKAGLLSVLANSVGQWAAGR